MTLLPCQFHMANISHECTPTWWQLVVTTSVCKLPPDLVNTSCRHSESTFLRIISPCETDKVKLPCDCHLKSKQGNQAYVFLQSSNPIPLNLYSPYRFSFFSNSCQQKFIGRWQTQPPLSRQESFERDDGEEKNPKWSNKSKSSRATMFHWSALIQHLTSSIKLGLSIN